jgi:Phosphotransferase enzyme family
VDKKRPTGNEPATGVELWSSRSWRRLAVAWLDAQLAASGIERTGDVEQPHLRPWATVLKAPTNRGVVWLKAAGATTAFEIGLYQLLDRIARGQVLQPIAIDVARGWAVLPDGGQLLGERMTAPDDLAQALVKVLPQYARLQLALQSQVVALLDLGVRDMRAPVMVERFDEAVAALRADLERLGTAADRAAFQRVLELRDRYADWCARLAAAPVPPSLDHNDLHPWNMFVRGTCDSLEVRFYDWGDSVIAHPFASMLVGIGFLQMQLRVGVDDARILRARDAYLEVFDHLAPRADLIDALELACRVGKVARALTWNRAVRALGDETSREYARAPLDSLLSLLDDDYLGRT